MKNISLSLSKLFPLSQTFSLSLHCGWMRWYLCSVWKMRSAFRRSTTTIVGWPTTATQPRCPWCLWELRVSVGTLGEKYISYDNNSYSNSKAIFFSGLATNLKTTVWLDRISLNIFRDLFGQFLIIITTNTNTSDALSYNYVGKHYL